MLVVDLFAGGGGFAEGARQAGATLALSIEADPHIARVYAENATAGAQQQQQQHAAPRVETLGSEHLEPLAAELGALRAPYLLHASPPCQCLSQCNQTTRDAGEGLRLVRFYLDLVARARPAAWSMEQVPHAAVKALLQQRGAAFTIVDAVDFGVPQRRVRLVAGSPSIVAALEARRGSGPTVLPRDVLVSLQPAARFMLTSGTTNQPIKQRDEQGRRVTVGSRRMRPDEGARDLFTPCHTVFTKPGRVFDSEAECVARRLTPGECAVLQGFPADYRLDERSLARSYRVVGNAIPPPLARCIVEAAIAALPTHSHTTAGGAATTPSSLSTG